ncbi:MAG TPA: phosphohistidine phosphatase SixA [Candidatus Binataceae bacterium]|jgi:phosphohistidine phosphatase|nr:phosphohistidine phosphatase SixA [Candidatus Binataceae bacterium]
MRLYLIRHGMAEDHNPAGDAERALTPKGRLRMAEEAKSLRDLKVRPEIILTSPLRRAVETATIVAQELGGLRVEHLRELGSGPYGPADILAALQPYKNLKEIALVGHLPGLAELASFMLTGSTSACQIELKKGAVACLEQAPIQGQDRFVLIWLQPPKVLRSL